MDAVCVCEGVPLRLCVWDGVAVGVWLCDLVPVPDCDCVWLCVCDCV